MELILKEKNKYNNISVFSSSNVIKIKGPLGVTKASFGGPGIKIEDNKIFIWTKSDLRTFLTTFHNIIRGVQIGFLSEISLVGLGYRLFYEDDVLLLKMGFGHYIKVDRPKDIHTQKQKKCVFWHYCQKERYAPNGVRHFLPLAIQKQIRLQFPR